MSDILPAPGTVTSTHKARKLTLQPFDTITPIAIPWIWEGYFARGYMTPLVGDGGAGKGHILIDVIARLTRGASMPDGSPNPFVGAPKSCVIIESEDSPENTIRPLLDKQGADVTRVYFLNVEGHGFFNLGVHLPELEERIHADPDIVFLAISALNDFLPGNTKTGMDAEVRRLILNPLNGMVTRTRIAAVPIHHIGKATERVAHHRTLDSVAYYNKPRLMLGVVSKRESQSAPTIGRLGGLKNNLGQIAPCIGYEITEQGIRWTGPTDELMKDLFGATGAITEQPVHSKYKEGETIAFSMLSTGACSARSLTSAWYEAGVGERLQKRLLENLGIIKIVGPDKKPAYISAGHLVSLGGPFNTNGGPSDG